MPLSMALVEGYRSIRKLWTRLDRLNLSSSESVLGQLRDRHRWPEVSAASLSPQTRTIELQLDEGQTRIINQSLSEDEPEDEP